MVPIALADLRFEAVRPRFWAALDRYVEQIGGKTFAVPAIESIVETRG